MKEDMLIPEGSEILVATNYMKEIIEGRAEIVDGLKKIATQNDIVMIKVVLSEGLEKADKATAEGLKALGRLIAVSSKIVNYSEEEDEIIFREDKKALVTADILLMCLIGPDSAAAVIDMLHESWLAGVMPYTWDNELVLALLSVKEGDIFNIETFASVLKVLYIARNEDTIEDRLEWDMTERSVKKIRDKAMITDKRV